MAGYNDRESAAKRGYGHKWRVARAAYLKEHSLCVTCQDNGRVTAASVVDHIRPHKGDAGLFWDKNNWQALCKTCHDGHKKRVEMGGKISGFGENGLPKNAIGGGWGG